MKEGFLLEIELKPSATHIQTHIHLNLIENLQMMNDRHPSPDYSREEKQPSGDSSHPKGVIRPGSAQSGHGPPPSSMGPPPSYTTVTMTTDNTPGARVTEINLNIGYYKSLPGIVKVVQMVSITFTSFLN